MSRYLLVDIGAGTMDILYYDDMAKASYKAVVASPVIQVAKKIESSSGKLLVTGVEMGGGLVTKRLKDRAKNSLVIVSASAAATLNHDLKRVESWGFKVVVDQEASSLKSDKSFTHICLGDLDSDRLKAIVGGLGVPYSFDIMGICAQDHGVPPVGVSHLDYRHRCFVDILDDHPFAHVLLYKKEEIPATMNRLNSIARHAEKIPAAEVYVMDSGMAAILGATLDIHAKDKGCYMVLDVATSHTVAAVIANNEIAGFLEYHTHDITRNRLEELIEDLANGKLNHAQILSEGGHGCYLRKTVGFKNLEAIIATGPKRDIMAGSKLPITLGAPLGDNMMTGTAGLLEAIQKNN